MNEAYTKWLKRTIAEMQEHAELFPGDIDADHGKVLKALRIALASLEAERAVNTEPVAWIRYCSDGTIDGPLMNYQIEDCRKLTWTPLYAVKPTKASIHDVLTDMDALEGCREWLLSQERTVNVGPVDGAHDVLIESTAGYLVRVVDACRAAMLQEAK